MQKFVDRAGRIWIVDIDNTTLRRVKTLTGVHLLEAIDGDLITRLSTDPLLLGDVLYAICKPQADQQQITDEAFGEGLAGNSIDDATGALLEALINYFPESRRRLLRKAAERQKLIETRGQLDCFIGRSTAGCRVTLGGMVQTFEVLQATQNYALHVIDNQRSSCDTKLNSAVGRNSLAFLGEVPYALAHVVWRS